MDMDLREILRRSSNAGISLVTQEHVGETRFAKGVSSFGIGSVTGIDYPGEVEGLVKQLNQYDGASLGSMSFGQSLAIPLIQMVEAVGSIANDGSRMTPHFLVSKNGEAVSWDSVGTSVSKETADEVTDMMREVVRSGTATAAQVEGYDIAGKTGTGEQADESGYIQNHFVSSLIGFAPASDPEVLVYVGLNGTPYLAATSSAPLFSSIMSEALTDMGVLPAS
jgi:cell division protein FtsI (penicillin-binding protein 3)